LFHPFQKIVTSSSQHLHTTLDGRILFNSIDIILPPAWSNNCVTNATVTSYNGAPTDAQITTTHPIFGDDLWTKQSGGCGERGEQMYVSERSVRDGFENVEKKFVNEFMKYRYGVFDTNGFDGDAIYPKCSASGNPVCIDAMSLESPTAYNRYMPTKQNQLCDRMSKMDVVMRSADFNGSLYVNGQR
jgi:calcium-activated chloride channel regulator 4